MSQINEFIEKMKTPMLCRDSNSIDEELLEKYMQDNNRWIAQEKLNGVRMLIAFSRESGLHFYSRSLKEYTGNIFMAEKVESELIKMSSEPFILDTECIYYNNGDPSLEATTGMLSRKAYEAIELQQISAYSLFTFYAFDTIIEPQVHLYQRLYNCKRDIKQLYKAITRCCDIKYQPFLIKGVDTVSEKKGGFYNEILQSGGEGIVLKNLDTPYYTTKSRPLTDWIKVKKEETVDAFITGYVDGNIGTAFEGKIGALILSCYVDGKIKEVARVSGLDSATREDITYDREFYLGTVIELSGQEFTARNHKLKHAKIVRWREDKKPADCIINIKGGE